MRIEVVKIVVTLLPRQLHAEITPSTNAHQLKNPKHEDGQTSFQMRHFLSEQILRI